MCLPLRILLVEPISLDDGFFYSRSSEGKQGNVKMLTFEGS